MSFPSTPGNPRAGGNAASCSGGLRAANPAASPVGNDITSILRPSGVVTL